eukprot:3134564-Pyramimonas_sp.AAC.2
MGMHAGSHGVGIEAMTRSSWLALETCQGSIVATLPADTHEHDARLTRTQAMWRRTQRSGARELEKAAC